jgi:Flp pilus assembly protein TadD
MFAGANQHLEALRILAPHLAANPDDAGALALCAQLFIATHKFTDAVTMSERLVRLAPNDSLAWEIFSVAADANGDHIGARRAALRLLELAPDSWSGHAQIALSDARARTVTKRSLEHATRAVQLAPNEVEAHRALGDVASLLNKRAIAKQAFATALRLDPFDFGARSDAPQAVENWRSRVDIR